MSSGHPSTEALERQSWFLSQQAISSSTRTSYSTAWRSLVDFCLLYSFLPLPAEVRTIVLWISYLSLRGLQGSTIKKYVMAISSLHIENGFFSPVRGNAFISRCITGAYNLKPTLSHKPKLPVTPALLFAINPFMDMNNLDHAMLWAAFTLGTFCLLRNGEIASADGSNPIRITSIRHADFLSTAGVKAMWYHIPRTKTHPHDGEDVLIGSPYALGALHRYLAFRNRLQVIDDSSCLFSWADGTPLTRRSLHSEFCKFATMTGVSPSSYRGVSFRSGGATALTDAGVPIEHIRMVGRWKSNAYKVYIRTSPQDLMKSLAKMRSC